MITSYPATPSQEWFFAVARGQVPNASVINIYGYQGAVKTTSVPIWENATAYTYPASATAMLLYSSSASDTAVSVLISGLNASYAPVSETLILTNGATGVSTVNSYRRINGMAVVGTVNPVGVLTLSSSDKVTDYAKIGLVGLESAGRTQMSIYTVPAGYTFYLTRVNAYASPNNNANFFANYSVWTRNIDTGIHTVLQQAPYVNTYETVRVAPRPYPAKTDIQWRASMSAGTSAISIGVEGILMQGT